MIWIVETLKDAERERHVDGAVLPLRHGGVDDAEALAKVADCEAEIFSPRP